MSVGKHGGDCRSKGSIRLVEFARCGVVVIGLMVLTACHPYRVPVEQGNYLRKDLLQQVKVGSSKQQVLDSLGKPILDNAIEDDTWVYAYTREDNKTIIRYRTIIKFKNDRVINMLIVEE